MSRSHLHVCLLLWLALLAVMTGCAQDDETAALSGTVAALAAQNAELATLAAQNAALATRAAAATPTALPTATATSAAPLTPAETATDPATAVPSPTATGTSLPTSTRPPATAPPPPPSPSTIPNPQLVDWHISNISELPDNGRQVSLVWRVDQVPPGAEVRIFASTQQRFQPWWVVEPAGQMTVDLQRTIFPDPTLLLIVHNPVTNLDYATWSLQIPWSCQHAYFFPVGPTDYLPCPQGPPVTSVAAEQYFENGRMLWIEALDRILVFYADGQYPQYESLPDLWQAGDPDIDPALTPPPDRYQPVRGFNKVWLERPDVRTRIGWGLVPEQVFNTQFQFPEHETTPGAQNLVVRMLDGQVRMLYGYDAGSGAWDLVSRP